MFDLKKLRESLNLRQTDMASLLNCTQPNIAQMEKDYKDLTTEQYKILIAKYGENTVNKYTMSQDAIPTEPKERRTRLTLRGGGSEYHNLQNLIEDQQKTINDLIEAIKKLQEENSKLTSALIQQKVV